MSDEPVVIEPLVGFRKFVVWGKALVSPIARTRWEGPVMEAECLRSENFGPNSGHQAPHPSCSCGVYAMHRRDPMLVPPQGSWAIVALWGRVEVHEIGMRAQHARICAIAKPTGPGLTAFESLAERFGIDLVRLPEFEAAAAEYGRRVDPWMLPGGRET